MANAGWLKAFGDALTQGARTGFDVKQYQDQLARQSLLDALRQAAFDRQGKWHQQDVDWRESQAVEDKRRWAAAMTRRDKDMDYRMFRDRLEAEMEGVRSREAADLKTALINLEYDRREKLAQVNQDLTGGGDKGMSPFMGWMPETSTLNALFNNAYRQSNVDISPDKSGKYLPAEHWLTQGLNILRSKFDPTFWQGPLGDAGGQLQTTNQAYSGGGRITFDQAVNFINELKQGGEEIDWNYIQQIAPYLDIQKLRAETGG